MTLDEAHALSARIHAAAKALNTVIYEASAAGLDVDLKITETHVVHGEPTKTVQSSVSMPIEGNVSIGQIGATADPSKFRLRADPPKVFRSGGIC